MNEPKRTPSEMIVFRRKLIVALMLVVSALTGIGLYLAQRTIADSSSRELQQSFPARIASLLKGQECRHADLVEQCAAYTKKPRIHAALEDNALDLLYPSAKDELRDLMEGEESPPGQAAQSLHAKFYRFLDGAGAVLTPPNPKNI